MTNPLDQYKTGSSLLGVRAKTYVPPVNKTVLPSNQKVTTTQATNKKTNPTLQQLSKDIYTASSPTPTPWQKGHALNSGGAEIAKVGGNILNNVANVAGKAGNWLTGSKTFYQPEWKNMFDGIYGPTKEEIAKSEASTRVADAILKSRGVTPSKQTTTAQPKITGETSQAVSSGTVNPNQAKIDEIKSQIATLSQQRDAQTSGGASTGQVNARGGIDKVSNSERNGTRTQGQTGQGAESYWKQLLDQGKEGTNGEKPKIVKDSMDRISQLQQQMKDLESDYGMRSAGANVKGRDIAVKAGRGRELQQNYQAEKNALAQQLNQANTQLGAETSMYGTQTGLLQGLIGQTSPQMQFGQLTDPTTGQPMSGGQYGSNPQLQNAVKLAYDIYQKTGDIYDPQITKLLSTFGMPADVLLTQMAQMGAGGQTPNFQAQSASNATRNSLIQQLGPQAVALDSALRSIDALAPVMTDFMSKSGIAPTDNRTLNELSQDYRGAWGDQATTQFQTMLGELQKFSAAVLGSGTSLTPSAQTALAELQNPGTLSLPRIQMYLQEIKGLGQNNLNVQLGQIQNMGGTGYFGNQGQQTTQSSWQPNQSTGNTAWGGNVQNPYAQAGMGILPSLLQTAGGIWAGAKTFFK